VTPTPTRTESATPTQPSSCPSFTLAAPVISGQTWAQKITNSNNTGYSVSKIEVYWLGPSALTKITWLAASTTTTLWSGTSYSPTYITLSSSGVLYKRSSSTMTLTFDSTIDSSTVRFVKYTLDNGCYYIYGSH
jgi:hypothetical protein